MDKMKKCLYLLVISVVLIIFMFPASGVAESPEKPLQLSLFPPLQIHNQETSIRGLRLSLYGFNQDLKGLDIGLINRLGGDMNAVQLGIVNYVNGNAKGLQAAFYNQAHDFSGVQVGVANTAQKTHGLQIGIVNSAVDMDGLQIGLLYNSTDTLRGIQIGLLNFIWERKPVFFFPIINAAF